MTPADPPHAAGAANQGGLLQALSRFDATMIVVGTIIGIGVFFTPGRVALEAGTPLLALCAWLLGGVIACAGACTYAQLALLLPEAGGPYVYLRHGCGRLAAFLYGWMSLLAIVSGAIAVIARTFAEHLARLVPLSEPAQLAVGAGAIVLLTAVNVAGIRRGSRVQNVFTVLKLAALLFLVVAGFARGHEPLVSAAPATDAAPPGAWGAFGGVLAAMVGVLFSFGGWQNLNNVASELKDVRRDFAPAILLGVACTTAVYLLANVAYLRLLPLPELAASNVPAAAALERAVGEAAGDLTALLILCSAFGVLNGVLLAQPRIYFAMGKDGTLPKAFARVHPRFRTPAVAIVAQGSVALAMLFLADVDALLEYVVFADWLFFALGGVALFVVRRNLPERARALPRLGHPWLPLFYTAAAWAMAVAVLVAHWQNARIGLLVLAAGAAAYAVFARRRP